MRRVHALANASGPAKAIQGASHENRRRCDQTDAPKPSLRAS
jgi:hypothetical protein